MAVYISYKMFKSPLGILHLAHSPAGLAGIELPGSKQNETRDHMLVRLRKRFGEETVLVEDRGALSGVTSWLEQYFDNPASIPVYRGPYDFGGTDFQKLVWLQLLKIPTGAIMSYKDVALAIGRPGALRAVGSACGANPIPIVVPCHRVVATNGIGGFGGGLPMKVKLLDGEGVVVE